MQYDEFLGQVQQRARLGSLGDAERATRATLESLAERLANGEAEHLAAQLPDGIAHYLRQARTPSSESERLSVDDFLQRVHEREGVELPDAVYHTRAVLEVLREAISSGQMAHIRAQLPAEFDRLFEAGSTGNLRERG